jgi:hypothetical protein
LNLAESLDDRALASLSRPPTPEERGKTLIYVAGSSNRQQALEDVLWSLLNTKEFIFLPAQHAGENEPITPF